jgi:hypothetical protein
VTDLSDVATASSAKDTAAKPSLSFLARESVLVVLAPEALVRLGLHEVKIELWIKTRRSEDCGDQLVYVGKTEPVARDRTPFHLGGVRGRMRELPAG